MGARSIPPPPLAVRRVLHVAWPFVGVLVTGLMVPVIVTGAFMVLVDRRARLFRASCLAVVLMWVDIRMLLGCWALWARTPDQSSPTWREDHEKLFSTALDSLMYYARRWVGLEVVLEDRMHFGSDVMGDQADDTLAIGWRQQFARVRKPLGKPVDPEPPIGVEHHLDDRGVFQKPGDRRPEGRAQHARAAKDRLRFLVSGRHVVPVLLRDRDMRPWIGDE